MSIEYTVGISDADAHLIDVRLSIPSPDAKGQVLQLPNWIPGSYMIRDFSRNIVSIRAESAGAEVALTKLDKSSWQAPAGLSQLDVIYKVYAWDLSVRAAHVDKTHAFFNGTSVFLSVEGVENDAHRVTLQRPTHDVQRSFNVATTLPVVSAEKAGFGLYEASSYDELIDHPVEMGTFKRLSFSACGVEHEMVFTGACHFDEQRVVDDMTRICEYEIGFFGEPAPYEKYIFMVMVTDAGYGGLEHRSSTALMITRDNLPVTGDTKVSDSYLNFLGLCSHEYFHNWNVKRIKPACFVPYELKAESYTELLWFFEGMTSYYDDLILVRCALIDHERYLEVLTKTLTRVQRGPGRLTQSVTDSSLDAWHKFYKQDENSPNAIVSYYAKGALIALCLDSLMRRHSNNELSLDDLMRKLWQQWLENPQGLKEQEPQAIASSMLGVELSDFFDAALYQTDDLPLQQAFEYFGVELTFRARGTESDTGGVSGKSDDEKQQAVKALWLGANVADAPGGVKIIQVINGSPAERAGLAAGDLLIAMDGFSVNKADVEKHLLRLADKSEITLHYFRLGQLSISTLPVETAPEDTAQLKVMDKSLLPLWLGEPAKNHS